MKDAVTFFVHGLGSVFSIIIGIVIMVFGLYLRFKAKMRTKIIHNRK